MSYSIDFEPMGRWGKCSSDESLLDCARRLGVGITCICGGVGKCRSCRVKILKGTVSAPTTTEREVFSSRELQDGWRLACRTYPTTDCKLDVQPESMTSPQRAQTEGLEIEIAPQPTVQAFHLKLPAPSLSDPRADDGRLLEAINRQHRLQCRTIDIDLLRDLSSRLRSWNWECQASVRDGEVVSVGAWPSPHLGLAIDLGTTKIAGYLIDLSSGQTLAAKAMMNPQTSYGEDVISRIHQVIKSPSQGVQMQQLAVDGINRLAVELCKEANAGPEEIVDAVIVGNTAMHHLLLRLPVRQLARSPFVPAVRDALDIKAGDVGLDMAPGAYVHLLPNIAGYVGGDHTAALLACGAVESEEVVVVLDIGTNTEVSLIDDGKITCVSCASGPAFEGGHIKDGMRAAGGAIERLRITGHHIQYQTIDEMAPVGICGSGVLDAVTQLYLAGVLDKGGRMNDNHPRVRFCENQREFVLVDQDDQEGRSPIVITQQDVRELQMAKAAIRTGIQALLEMKGRTENEIEWIIIAGTFGTYKIGRASCRERV